MHMDMLEGSLWENPAGPLLREPVVLLSWEQAGSRLERGDQASVAAVLRAPSAAPRAVTANGAVSSLVVACGCSEQLHRRQKPKVATACQSVLSSDALRGIAFPCWEASRAQSFFFLLQGLATSSNAVCDAIPAALYPQEVLIRETLPPLATTYAWPFSWRCRAMARRHLAPLSCHWPPALPVPTCQEAVEQRQPDQGATTEMVYICR